ncbi:MAG: HlyD family efflux transporter periplasmic adaptor subunit [Planctomycetaceae bacterium]|nr:MAG: HlyD family efflux transporter periplasmic adaptor subunit [Planctomycetaceae bacterium]
MSRWLWRIVGGAAVLTLVMASGWWLRPAAVAVDWAVVDRGPLTVTVREEGLTRIRERYEVSTPLAGRLMRITLSVGDRVEAEQTVLARMEPNLPSLLDPRAIAAAEARVRAAERRQQVAQLLWDSASIEAEHAESERARLYQLKLQEAVADSEMDRAELESRLKADALRAAQYGIEIAQYELELEKSALLLTKSDLTGEAEAMELVIRSPIDGRVLRLHREDSAVLQAGTVLMEIGDPGDLEVAVDVLSRDAVRIRSGAEVRIDRWGGDQPLAGRVRYVEPSGFTKVSAMGVEEQRVYVVIDLEGPPEQRESLGDQFRVEAEITVWHADSVVRLPTAALFRSDRDWATFVVIGDVAELRLLEIGQLNESFAEVLAGIEVGDRVIAYPSDRVTTGVRVAPR